MNNNIFLTEHNFQHFRPTMINGKYRKDNLVLTLDNLVLTFGITVNNSECVSLFATV